MKMKISQLRQKGVTLIEVLLVLSIMGMIIFLSTGYIQQRSLATRMDRTSLQMQQILNAGLSYYVANGSWPSSLSCLQGTGDAPCNQVYLPASIVNPFGQAYSVTPSTTNPPALLYVYTVVTAANGAGSAIPIAQTIAGTLPLSYTTATAPSKDGGPPPNDGSCVAGKKTPSTCYVVASVNIPGQNLNNASAVNFTGVYHSGACVPVPTCPVDANGNTMTPQIMVSPVSVTGVYDAPASSTTCSDTDSSGCQLNTYPINSFTAYATTYAEQPNSCTTETASPCYADADNTELPSGNYWRVCLAVSTERGAVTPNSSAWGRVEGTVMVMTRCAIQDEPSGSNFDVWAP